jgi:high-affinity Fe2+/Pb2+ permease
MQTNVGRIVMSTKGQVLVALVAAAAGLIAIGIFWLIASPELDNRNVAIATLIYAAAYVLTVPRAERWLRRMPNPGAAKGEAL